VSLSSRKLIDAPADSLADVARAVAVAVARVAIVVLVEQARDAEAARACVLR
jgi:hypothetical protein